MSMTPTAQIAAAAEPVVVIDALGRRLAVRNITALDKLRLFKAAGPALAQNEPWLGMALLACSVHAIDDVPVPMPGNEHQIEALVARLGDAGIAAAAEVVAPADAASQQDMVASAGN